MRISSSPQKTIEFFAVTLVFSFFCVFTFFNRILNSFFWGRSLFVQLVFLFFFSFIFTLILYRRFSHLFFEINRYVIYLAIFLWIPIIVFELAWDGFSTTISLNNHIIQQTDFFPNQVSGIYGITDSGDRIIVDFLNDGKSPILVSNNVEAVTITYLCGPTQKDTSFYIDRIKVSLPLYCDMESETTKTFIIYPTIPCILISLLISTCELGVLLFTSLLINIFLKNFFLRLDLKKPILLNWNGIIQSTETNHYSKGLVNSRKSLILIIIVEIITFILFYQLNRITPLVADDYVISFNNFTGERIQNLADVLSTSNETYFLWSGRLFSLLLSYWMTTFDKYIFNIINSFFFIYLIFLIFINAKHKSNSKTVLISKFVSLICLIWFFVPAFGETILWRAGSPNYLWNLCFILTVMVRFSMEFEESIYQKDDIFSAILFLFFGIIAGMAQENSSGAIIFFISVYVILFLIKKQWKHWMFTGLIGCWLGYWILILAPGNGIRSDNFVGLGFLSRLDMVLSRFMHDLFPLYLLFFILLLFVGNRKKSTLINYLSSNIQIPILFICSLFSFSMMIFTNWYPERASFGSAIFVIVAIFILISSLIESNIKSKKDFFIFLPLLICLIFSYCTVYKDLSDCFSKWTNRIEIINNAKNAKEENIIVEIIRSTNPHNPFYNVTDLSPDQDGWPNYFIARYYGINSISGK